MAELALNLPRPAAPRERLRRRDLRPTYWRRPQRRFYAWADWSTRPLIVLLMLGIFALPAQAGYRAIQIERGYHAEQALQIPTAVLNPRQIQASPCSGNWVEIGRWPAPASGSYQASGSTGRWLRAAPKPWSIFLTWPGPSYVCMYAPRARFAEQHAL